MKILRRFPVMAFALVLLSIVALCIAQRSVGLLLVAGALAAMSWYVTEGPRGRVLPQWVSSVLIIAVSLNVFVELLQPGVQWMHVLGRFAVWMTLIKLYERKTPRAYGHLLALSLLLVLTGAVQSTELLFGAVVLVYAVLGFYVLLQYQLYAAQEQAKERRRVGSPRGYRLVPPAKPIIGRPMEGQFRLLAVALAGVGLVLSALLFVIFPRNVGDGVIIGLQGLTTERRPGFTDAIDLQSGTRITESRQAVFALRVLDESGKAIRFGEPILLRGGVLDRYEGNGRWRPSPAVESHMIDTEPGILAPLPVSAVADDPEAGPRSITQQITPIVPQPVLFAMGTPVAVATERAGVVRFDPRTQILTRDFEQGREPYTVVSQPEPSDQTLSRLTRGRTTNPEVSPLRRLPIEELARSLLRAAEVAAYPPPGRTSRQRYRWNEDAATVFRAHLRSAIFTYDTDLSDQVVGDLDADPVERFLFQTQRGHCEYFASALAALCANVDVPARVITGFIAYDYDQEREAYLVLESNAHAWAEVRTGPLRWTTFDPTPPLPLREIHSAETTLADRLSWLYQRFEGSWNAGVVSFDRAAQSRLADSFDVAWSARIERVLRSVRTWLAQVNRAFYFGPAGYIWMGVVAFALLLAVMVLIKLMRRSRAIRRTLHLESIRGADHQRMLRQLGFYLDMLAVLDRAGRGKPIWRPPLRHARHLHAASPEAAGLARRITEVFYRARYGRRQLTGEDVRRANQMVDELAGQLQVRR